MNNRTITYGFFDYLKKILIIIITFYFLTFFAFDSDPLYSLISLSLNLLICLNIGCYLFFKNPKWNIIISFFFLLKIFIGVIHYLYFFDNSYFSSGDYAYLTFEFANVHEHVELAVEYKKENGIFAFFQKLGGITHQEVWSFISIPFVYYGTFFMNIAPINSFFASLTTVNLLIISKHYYSLSQKQLYFVLILSSLFPFTLISSLFWRDVVGMYILSLGFILILLSKKSIILNIFSIVISSALFYFYRTVYPIFLIFSFFLTTFKTSFVKTITAAIVSLSIAYFVFINYSIQYLSIEDLNAVINYNFLAVLIKVPIGFIGPFPWNQFIDNNIFSYQIQEYFQAIFNLTFLYFFFRNYKVIVLKYKNDIIFQTSFLLIFAGLLNPYMHLVYVSFAFIYLIPFLANHVTLKVFFIRFLFIGILLFIFNILYIYFISNGLNLSRFWN